MSYTIAAHNFDYYVIIMFVTYTTFHRNGSHDHLNNENYINSITDRTYFFFCCLQAMASLEPKDMFELLHHIVSYLNELAKEEYADFAGGSIQSN